MPCNAWVASDPILLERILFNLVTNAVRYTERGGVVVGCRRRGNSCASMFAIPAPAFRRINARAYSASSTSWQEHLLRIEGGLGLGLAIVDRLGRLLGHRWNSIRVQAAARASR